MTSPSRKSPPFRGFAGTARASPPRPFTQARKKALRQGGPLDKGALAFGWDVRKARSKQRNGTKVTGVGVAVSGFVGGSVGFDGLFVIKPDGHLYVQTGIGNLGTESVMDCQRVAAEMVGMPWEKTHVTWGDTSKHLPWSCVSGGSQTIHAHTRASDEAVGSNQEGSALVTRI